MAAENRIIRFESYDFDIMAKFLKRPYENDDSTDRTLNSNLPSKIVPPSPPMLTLQAIHGSGMLCQRSGVFFQTTLARYALKGQRC